MPSPNGDYSHVRRTAPTHITWKKIRTYTTTYTRTGTPPKTERGRRKAITIRSITRPKAERFFRTSQGLKKFKAAHTTTTLREVIIVARTKTRKKPVDAEEIEEIEALEELEELEDEEDEDVEDEVEPDEEDEDDDDEEDEAPKRKSKKTTAKKAPAKKSRAAKENGKVGTQELAEHCEVDGRTLRIVLRKHNIEKDPDSGRYEWDSFEDKEVKKIVKLIAGGEAKRAKQESLDKLKARKAAQKEAAEAATKKGKKKSKKPPEPEPEDEVDDDEIEDEDDEEEEEVVAAPKKKRAKK